MVKSKDKQQQLDKLHQQIIDDGTCPELAVQATQLVFGEGHYDADIVFIGEAPGKNEDLQGKPFVGAAGNFLNEMLEMIGLKRGDIYITNIVKYRPPNNRDPLPEEKVAFLPYLQSQLEIIQPKLVVTLGRHSLNCFLPELSISNVHGKPKRIQIQYLRKGVGQQSKSDAQGEGNKVTASAKAMPLVILPLFHPAAALYNGSLRQTLIDDFARIPEIMKTI